MRTCLRGIRERPRHHERRRERVRVASHAGRPRAPMGVLAATIPLLLAGGLLVPAPAHAFQSTYEQVVSGHFALPSGEAELLLEEGIAREELPVVLVLARERGIAPTVVISRRQRGTAMTPWVDVARQMGLGAGVFHVDLSPNEVDDTIRRAAELFRATPPEGWNGLDLSDAEVVTLANVRVLSRGLGVGEGEVLRARAEGGSWSAAANRLVGHLLPAGVDEVRP